MALWFCVCCRVFQDDIQGRDCGEEASQWLSHYLGEEKTFRLVHFEPEMRARRPVKTEPLFPQSEVSSFMCWSQCWLIIPWFVKELLVVIKHLQELVHNVQTCTLRSRNLSECFYIAQLVCVAISTCWTCELQGWGAKWCASFGVQYSFLKLGVTVTHIVRSLPKCKKLKNLSFLLKLKV